MVHITTLMPEIKTFKEEHSKYISLINDSHDFKSGLTGLETLTTEKAKETLKNIDNEITIASELLKIHNALNVYRYRNCSRFI